MNSDFWKSLESHTDIKETIKQMLIVDGVLTIIVDALKWEFCDFSLFTKNVEKELCLNAMMKL